MSDVSLAAPDGRLAVSNFIEALQAEISTLERHLAEDPTYVKLSEVRRVLAIYKDGATSTRRNTGRRPPTSGISAEILDVAGHILEGRTQPTPTREIMGLLVERGLQVEGSRPQNTVSSLLSKSDGFFSHGRSGWTLAVPNGHDKETAGDERFTEAASPTLLDSRPDQPVEPGAKGREAGPGGGT